MSSVQKKIHTIASQEGKNHKPSQLELRVSEPIEAPPRGYYIPVKQLFGQAASNALDHLEALMCDPKAAGKICIYGETGIGKTILIKHLHNCVLTWVHSFDYLFWITSPAEFRVREVQDAVAGAVRCDISDICDLTVRAEKLSAVIAGLGRVVLFLDGLQEFSRLEEVGIPIPCEGNGCKVVIATRSDSVGARLDCDEMVKVELLDEKEAFQMFTIEAGIGTGCVSSIHDIARSIVKECRGVPSRIVEVANRLYGIRDIHEWRNTLFEMQNRPSETGNRE